MSKPARTFNTQVAKVCGLLRCDPHALFARAYEIAFGRKNTHHIRKDYKAYTRGLPKREEIAPAYVEQYCTRMLNGQKVVRDSMKGRAPAYCRPRPFLERS